MHGPSHLRGEKEEETEYRDGVGDMPRWKAERRLDDLHHVYPMPGGAHAMDPPAESERPDRGGASGDRDNDGVQPAAEEQEDRNDHCQRYDRRHGPVERADRLD